jgi:hypothetical protein
MEERLDDAIHVLRNHAEGQMPAHSGMPGHMMSSSHSNGIMGNMGYNNMIGHGGHVESPHMVGSCWKEEKNVDFAKFKGT